MFLFNFLHFITKGKELISFFVFIQFINPFHNHELIRCKELSSLAAIDEGKSTIPNKNPLAVIEDETSRHKLKVEAFLMKYHICLWNQVKKMEEEMEEVFCKKVEEKHAKIGRMER